MFTLDDFYYQVCVCVYVGVGEFLANGASAVSVVSNKERGGLSTPVREDMLSFVRGDVAVLGQETCLCLWWQWRGAGCGVTP